jgi:hypothetical protein
MTLTTILAPKIMTEQNNQFSKLSFLQTAEGRDISSLK